MTPKKTLRFGVIAGSAARGVATAQSDLDYVRIGRARKTPKKLNAAHKKQLSEISYTESQFLDLHKKGSLFLYHLFREGILIEGNSHDWEALRSSFKVRRSFRIEVRRYKAVLRHVVSGGFTEASLVPYLAHLLKALKNIAIFSLATHGRYVFDKRKALIQCYRMNPRYIKAMLRAEAVLDREHRLQRNEWAELLFCARKLTNKCRGIISTV